MKAKFKKRSVIKPVEFIYGGPFIVLEKCMGKYLLINLNTLTVSFKKIKEVDECFILETQLTNENDEKSI